MTKKYGGMCNISEFNTKNWRCMDYLDYYVYVNVLGGLVHFIILHIYIYTCISLSENRVPLISMINCICSHLMGIRNFRTYHPCLEVTFLSFWGLLSILYIYIIINYSIIIIIIICYTHMIFLFINGYGSSHQG